MSDEERKPTSLKWRKSLYPDLAKVEDWLNKKGYTGEAGAVHVAMDEILELGIENARLREAVKAAYYEGWQDRESIVATEDKLHFDWDCSEARAAIREGGKDESP